MDRVKEIKELAAMTALNDMFKKGHFSICTLDSVANMLQVNPRGGAYDILRTLHCIDFSVMPKELRNEIPALIRDCLMLNPIYEFEHLKKQTIVVSQSPMGRLLSYVRG